MYNFFYNIYKVDYVKGQCFQRDTGHKMIGRIENVTSTNLLAVDLDAYNFEEYKEIRKLFLDRNIIPIEVSSGHGFHILIKIETCTDKGLLNKWLKILSDYNVDVDQHCKIQAGCIGFHFSIMSKVQSMIQWSNQKLWKVNMEYQLIK